MATGQDLAEVFIGNEGEDTLSIREKVQADQERWLREEEQKREQRRKKILERQNKWLAEQADVEYDDIASTKDNREIEETNPSGNLIEDTIFAPLLLGIAFKQKDIGLGVSHAKMFSETLAKGAVSAYKAGEAILPTVLQAHYETQATNALLLQEGLGLGSVESKERLENQGEAIKELFAEIPKEIHKKGKEAIEIHRDIDNFHGISEEYKRSLNAEVVSGVASGLMFVAGSMVSAPLTYTYAALSQAMDFSMDAIRSGEDESVIAKRFFWGAVAGATEVIPISHGLNNIVKNWGWQGFKTMMKGVGIEVGEEATQEGIQNVIDQLSKKGLYKKGHDFDWGELWHSMALGGFIGGVFGAAGTGYSRSTMAEKRRYRAALTQMKGRPLTKKEIEESESKFALGMAATYMGFLNKSYGKRGLKPKSEVEQHIFDLFEGDEVNVLAKVDQVLSEKTDASILDMIFTLGVLNQRSWNKAKSTKEKKLSSSRAESFFPSGLTERMNKLVLDKLRATLATNGWNDIKYKNKKLQRDINDAVALGAVEQVIPFLKAKYGHVANIDSILEELPALAHEVTQEFDETQKQKLEGKPQSQSKN